MTILVVDDEREVGFGHPDAACFDGGRDGHRREYMDLCIASADGFNPVESPAQQSPEGAQILGAAHDVVVRVVGSDRPNLRVIAEHPVNAVVCDGGA